MTEVSKDELLGMIEKLSIRIDELQKGMVAGRPIDPNTFGIHESPDKPEPVPEKQTCSACTREYIPSEKSAYMRTPWLVQGFINFEPDKTKKPLYRLCSFSCQEAFGLAVAKHT